VSELLPQHGAEQVNTIGDALMIRAAGAAVAVRLAVRIVEGVGGRHRFPAVRVGLHTGPAVAREADWFGATVNVASRVADAAAAGEVLFTDATRLAAADVEGLEFSYWDLARFKDVRQPVDLWAAAPPWGRWRAAGLSSTPCAGWRLRRSERRERLASALEPSTSARRPAQRRSARTGAPT
jgi:class 3 adenylate cyclase